MLIFSSGSSKTGNSGAWHGRGNSGALYRAHLVAARAATGGRWSCTRSGEGGDVEAHDSFGELGWWMATIAVVQVISKSGSHGRGNGGRAGYRLTSGNGGMVEMQAGRSTVHTGGALAMSSGEGTATSSGAITIRSANSGVSGGSGMLIFSSGSSKAGNGVGRVGDRHGRGNGWSRRADRAHGR